MIGLVIALLVVGARELFDTSVRSESDVEDVLEAPVLATIESLPRQLRVSVLGGDGGRFNDEYELLAANVAQIFDGHDGAVHLAVTSALNGEGKTTTAANLAAALARRGSRVVLADFDLRKPAVSEFMGIPRSAAGVNDFLSGSADLRSVLWRVEPNGANGSHRPRGARVARWPRRAMGLAPASRALSRSCPEGPPVATRPAASCACPPCSTSCLPRSSSSSSTPRLRCS